MSAVLPRVDPRPGEGGDPLLECLVVLARLHQRPQSAEALAAGLPLAGGRLTPELFVRAAERAGLAAKAVKRTIAKIPAPVLPAVLLLKGGAACVLVASHADGNVEAIFPEAPAGARRMARAALEGEYAGVALFAHPVYRPGAPGAEARPAPSSWFWGTLLDYKREYFNVLVAAVMLNFFTLASPLFVLNVYDRVVPNNAFETLWALTAGIAIVIGFETIVRTLRAWFIDTAGRDADVLISARLFEQVMGMRMSQRPPSVGGFASVLREFDTLRDFFTSATLVTLVDLPFALLFVTVIALINVPVALVPLAAIPVLVLAGLVLQWPMTRATREYQAVAAHKQGVLVEALACLETVKTLAAEGRMQARWEQAAAQSASSSLRSRRLSAAAVSVAAFVQQVVTVVVVVVGVYQIAAGSLTMGELIACTILGGRAIASLGLMAGLLVRYQQSRVALASLNKVMALERERPAGKTFLHRPSIAGDIEFDKVSFTYPGQPANALEGISFRIPAGKRVAILGRVGSGKSTLARLILGLYFPQSGAVRIDGTDVAQLDPASLRRNVGYVSQDAHLFQGTVRENIAMGAPLADDEAVLRAAQRAGVDRFASRHPAGYDMPVGEGGLGLSGGQRQAIATARALLGAPPVLLMDEPTSAMDNTSEQAFLAAMQEFVEGRTLVIITHKPSMLALVDRVILLDAGRLVADGPRDQVVQALRQGQIGAART